ncbi:TPA: radical SAM protein [Candidatus Geothermarchaeota archaeon]|nr:radical SAM protein [Candidatus Geothermarchaeota archaeon]
MSKIINIFKGSIDGISSTISIFRDSIKFTFGDEVYVFDLEARPIFMYFNDMLYERGLSGEIIEKKWISLNPPKRFLRRVIDKGEKRDILKYTFNRVGEILDILGVKGLYGLEDRLNIDRIWELESEEERFRRIYRPISILPPDQYLSLVFQPLEGCPYNKCSFCTFYRDRDFRYKTADEFREHVKEVIEFLGKSILIRRRIFLADANALFADTEQLLEYIKIIREYIDRGSIEGFYSFSDYFTVYKTVYELKTLRSEGYKRVYIGLESGSDDVLKILSKPGPAERSLELVKRLKEAGITVGIIILIGAGGREYYDEHVMKTIKILNAMPLDKRDIIYYSKLKIHSDSEYYKISREYGLTELDDEEMNMQIDDIRRGLKHIEKPIQAIYDIDETIY